MVGDVGDVGDGQGCMMYAIQANGAAGRFASLIPGHYLPRKYTYLPTIVSHLETAMLRNWRTSERFQVKVVTWFHLGRPGLRRSGENGTTGIRSRPNGAQLDMPTLWWLTVKTEPSCALG